MYLLCRPTQDVKFIFYQKWNKFSSSRWLNETSMIKTTKGFSFCQTFALFNCGIFPTHTKVAASLSLTAIKKVEIVWSLGKFYVERVWGHKNSLFRNLILFQHIFRVNTFIILFSISKLAPYKLQLLFLLFCHPHPSACFLYDKLSFNI